MGDKNAVRIVALILIVVGILALAYGSFSFTKETHEAQVGPLTLQVKEKQTVNIPVWAGVVGIVIGALSCFSRARRANESRLANEIHQLSFCGLSEEKGKNMGTILIIVLLILLLGAGGGYYGYNRYGAPGLGGVLGLVVMS